ncbi:MAG: rhomboid family intramembrane serine protease [Flavobacteriaceae bacterium]|nr:rhomboid family intramembrane serine protease [Flavobacteriaceae bacterium]
MDSTEEQNQFRFSPLVIAFPLYLVFFLWFVYWIEIEKDWYLIKYGIYPRTLVGLRGIVFSPFIHSSVSHLLSNSVPLAILTGALLYFYRQIAFKVLIYGSLLSGLFTWLIGRESYHVGASGIIYLLFSFIFFSGIIRKYYRLIAVSLIVIFLYGSIIWYILPISEEISWEGHLSGFVVGLLFAFLFRDYGPKRFHYDWEDESHASILSEDSPSSIPAQEEEEKMTK